MNICVLYFDGFCEHDIVFALKFLREEHVFTAGLQPGAVVSEEKQRFLPDTTIDAVDTDSVDLLLVPGGRSAANVFDHVGLRRFLSELDRKGKYIAGICWGADLMEAHGLRRDRRWVTTDRLYEPPIVDGNVITVNGTMFLEFAVEVGKIAGAFKDEAEAQYWYRLYKPVTAE